jgi:tetratricopeptide (TPR) repeat protein
MQAAIDRETGVRASFLKGCRFLAEEKWGQAGKEFETAIKAEPNNAVYHFWFGRATGEQAQRANPIRQPGLARRVKGEFERAVALDSTYVGPRQGLLEYYLQAPGFLGGSVDRAREQAEIITKLDTYQGGHAQAKVAFSAKDTAALIRAHEKLVVDFPDSTTSYFTLLNIQLARRQWAAAWTMADKLERLKPDMFLVRYVIGRVAAESGEQLDRGEASLRQYLQHKPLPNEPSLAATHWRLGMISEKRGDLAAARQLYQTAATMDPNLKQAKDALARVK